MSSVTTLTSLTYNICRNPAAYAVLLGSGVSRGAGIPTGYEISQNLISRIAGSNDGEVHGDLEGWFRENCKGEPNYSNVIESLGPKSAERQRILEPYFEAKGREGTTVSRVPTSSHRAVAKLMKDGIVRVIMTTNFDRLIERALNDQKVEYNLIDSPEKIGSFTNLELEKNCVIKIHGDYLDTRMLNTEEELTSYDPRMENLLKGIFQKHGLLICGWSATHDIALRNLIVSTENKHFSTYMTTVGALSPEAAELRDSKNVSIIEIENADKFFSKLQKSISKFVKFDVSNSSNDQWALEEAKNYLGDESKKIQLYDLYLGIFSEAEKDWLAHGINVPWNGSEEQLCERIVSYREIGKSIIPLTVLMARWSEGRHDEVLVRAISQIGREPDLSNGYKPIWLVLSILPARMLLYTVGMASLLSNRPELLTKIMLAPTTSSNSFEQNALYRVASGQSLGYGIKLAPLFNGQGKETPLSNALHEGLREYFKSEVPYDDEYNLLFDTFEIYLAFAFIAMRGENFPGVPSGSWLFQRPKNFLSIFESLQNPTARFGGRAFLEESFELMRTEARIDEAIRKFEQRFRGAINHVEMFHGRLNLVGRGRDARLLN